MASKTNYFSDKGMKELTLGQKIATPVYSFFYFLLTLSTYVFLLIVAFVIGMLVLEFNFNINKNFYDTLLEDEKKWFDSKESTTYWLITKLAKPCL
jgi:hypothetical protein